MSREHLGGEVYYRDVMLRMCTARMLDEVTVTEVDRHFFRYVIAELASEDIFGDERYMIAYDASLVMAQEVLANMIAEVEGVYEENNLTFPDELNGEENA